MREDAVKMRISVPVKDEVNRYRHNCEKSRYHQDQRRVTSDLRIIRKQRCDESQADKRQTHVPNA